MKNDVFIRIVKEKLQCFLKSLVEEEASIPDRKGVRWGNQKAQIAMEISSSTVKLDK